MNNMPKSTNILITGVGGPAGINATRLLTELGVPVYGVDSSDLSYGRFFCTAFRQIPVVSSFDEYASALKELIHEWNIGTVLPTVEEELPLIRAALEGVDVDIVLSPDTTIDICNDKLSLYRFSHEHKLSCAPVFQTADEPLRISDEKLFLKPRIGRGARGCRVINHFEAEHIASIVDDSSDWIIMEILPGREWTVDAYVARDGHTIFIAPRERLALSGGISLKGKTVRESRVIEMSKELLTLLSFRGPVCLQFKEDAHGDPKLVEVNARLSGGTMITAAAGANAMACVYDEHNGKSLQPIDWNEITVIGCLDYRPL